MSEQIIRDYWQYIIIAYIGFFIFLLYRFLRRKNKILVRIKTPMKEQSKWCKIEDDGKTVVVDKATKKKAGWSFTFTNKSLIPIKSWGRSYHAVDVFHNSPKAIEYDFSQKSSDAPKLTKGQVKEFANWQALKARYSRIEGPKQSWVIYLILILLITSIILQLLTSGKVRIG